jgi:predicted nucleic acid-binding protein
MTAYFDASAFLKLIIVEPGSAEARNVWRSAHRRLSSLLLYTEARAGIARAHRMHRIGASKLRAAATKWMPSAAKPTCSRSPRT